MNVKVSEIFTSAGKAFNQLGDLILQVQSGSSEGSSKWSPEEVDMLRTSVTKFNEDLNNLSSHIKSKQTSQIRQTIKNKAYSSAGMVQKVEVMPTTIIQANPVVIQDQVIFSQPSTIKIEHQLPTDLVTSQPQTSSHMTLNAINAQEEEEEMDDGSFDNNVKLESTSYTDVS